jgi:nucleoside-diphosphate-sugar epimerase
VKRILITGATGFVGRHLCRRLLHEGCKIRAVVRSAEAAASLPQSLEHVVIRDVAASPDWSEALRNVDVVIHLVARAHVIKETEADPLESYRKINVCVTEGLLEACHRAGVRRVVFLSSIGVLGRGADMPYRETDQCQPEDDYAKSKLEAEHLVAGFGREGYLETVVLRPPLVYGPGVGGNFLRILKLLRRGVPLPLGRVNNARSMIFVDNLTDAIVCCAMAPQAANETFHVADSIPIATSELVQELARHLHTPTRLLPVPVSWVHMAGVLTGKSLDVDRLTRSLKVDSSRIRQVLGWKPLVSKEEGLCRTVESFLRSQGDTDSWTYVFRKGA